MSTTEEDKSKEDVQTTEDSGNWYVFDAYDSNNEPAPVPSTDVPAPDIISSTSNMIIATNHGMGPLEQPLPDEHPSTPSKKQKVSDEKPMEDNIADL